MEHKAASFYILRRPLRLISATIIIFTINHNSKI
jgi:hypothetical protein